MRVCNNFRKEWICAINKLGDASRVYCDQLRFTFYAKDLAERIANNAAPDSIHEGHLKYVEEYILKVKNHLVEHRAEQDPFKFVIWASNRRNEILDAIGFQNPIIYNRIANFIDSQIRQSLREIEIRYGASQLTTGEEFIRSLFYSDDQNILDLLESYRKHFPSTSIIVLMIAFDYLFDRDDSIFPRFSSKGSTKYEPTTTLSKKRVDSIPYYYMTFEGIEYEKIRSIGTYPNNFDNNKTNTKGIRLTILLSDLFSSDIFNDLLSSADAINIVSSIIEGKVSPENKISFDKLNKCLDDEFTRITFLEFLFFYTQQRHSIFGTKENLKEVFGRHIQQPRFDSLKKYVGKQSRKPSWCNHKTKSIIAKHEDRFYFSSYDIKTPDLEKFVNHLRSSYDEALEGEKGLDK